jgi:hypothetical protein
MTTAPPHSRASTPSAEGRRHALLQALTEAGERHLAVTPNALLLHVADRLRRHTDHDTVGLGHVVRRLDELRRQEPSGSALIVGTPAIRSLIDRIAATFEAKP